jgi:aspartate/methionine/tyrosine aminotransferase
MDYVQFKARRAELCAGDSTLLDLSEMNLYRSLPAAFTGEFLAIEPSSDGRALHRCYLRDLMLESLEFEHSLRSRLLISHGVRRSLGALFQTLAERGQSVLIPSDVYPVYFEIAHRAGVRFGEYRARQGIPGFTMMESHDAVLVCDPLKPWGGSMSPADCELLRQWASHGSRLVIVDGAYSFRPSEHVRKLVRESSCALLGSLSKGWLIPDHAGYCLIAEAWKDVVQPAFVALAKDEQRLRVSFEALEKHAARPAVARERLLELAGAFGERMRVLGIQTSQVHGYFATTSLGFDELLGKGCMGMPASVFGASGSDGCVLSTLPPCPPGSSW